MGFAGALTGFVVFLAAFNVLSLVGLGAAGVSIPRFDDFIQFDFPKLADRDDGILDGSTPTEYKSLDEVRACTQQLGLHDGAQAYDKCWEGAEPGARDCGSFLSCLASPFEGIFDVGTAIFNFGYDLVNVLSDFFEIVVNTLAFGAQAGVALMKFYFVTLPEQVPFFVTAIIMVPATFVAGLAALSLIRGGGLN